MRLLSRLLIPLGLLGAVMAAFAFLQLDSAALLSRDGLTQMAAYASGFMTPDLSANHLRAIAHGTLETLAMSAIGTLLAALLGLLLALPAAGASVCSRKRRRACCSMHCGQFRNWCGRH